jgi:hypothetical protein
MVDLHLSYHVEDRSSIRPESAFGALCTDRFLAVRSSARHARQFLSEAI